MPDALNADQAAAHRHFELIQQAIHIAIIQHILTGFIGDKLPQHSGHCRSLAPYGVELLGLRHARTKARAPAPLPD
ncbi:hypothetical protein PTR25_19835 [Serratia nevei]|uniref:hypothetical protein n=1 Tax=Serratia TaxID=613 RepID=UPI00313CA965